MPFEDPWFREGKTTSPLDWERRMYVQTKNPIHVWRAFQICRACRCESFPEWVLEYFDRGASAIQELFDGSFDGDERSIPQIIADTLGFKRVGRGVRDTAFSKYALEHRDLMIATRVWREVELHPTQSKETIIADLAERENLSSETVWRAWDAWRGFLKQQSRTVTTSRKS